MAKRIAIIGSTGSIGQQALDVALRLPEHLRVVALAAGSNVQMLAEQAMRTHPAVVGVANEALAPQLAALLKGSGIAVVAGAEADALACLPDVDLVLVASVGLAGLWPALAAVRAGKTLAVANKESIVAAGDLLMAEAAQHGAKVVPVDSEHSAIFQCLEGESKQTVSRIILTASGGAFRDRSAHELEHVSPQEALAHPTWRMGKKITVDSATLMNKGLEVIEAHRLFGVPVHRIHAVLHQQSIIHSLVEFADGSVKAQLGLPDMRMPIAYALTYPNRLEWGADRLDLASVGALTFERLDLARYPCLALAYQAAEEGGTAPTVLSAADEVAVTAFLDGRLSFARISDVIQRVLDMHRREECRDLNAVRRADAWARRAAASLVAEAPWEH
jgi:1-deoxy-D-xylulose-5-phosphate reductoisomerase